MAQDPAREGLLVVVRDGSLNKLLAGPYETCDAARQPLARRRRDRKNSEPVARPRVVRAQVLDPQPHAQRQMP